MQIIKNPLSRRDRVENDREARLSKLRGVSRMRRGSLIEFELLA